MSEASGKSLVRAHSVTDQSRRSVKHSWEDWTQGLVVHDELDAEELYTLPLDAHIAGGVGFGGNTDE